nr:UDP-glycosyltransferase 74B1-like [Ipomoea batatas]
MEAQYCGHVLLLPYPAQGHINPLLQFAKRLASKGVKATIATTTYTVKSIHAAAVTVEPISDGFDDGGFTQAQKVDVYLNSFEQNGSRTLSKLPVEIEENGAAVVLPGIPPLYGPDIPSFITAPDSYPAYLAMKMRQFSNVGNADWIFANTFQELESEVVAGVSKVWPAKLIGPMVPSSYLDGRIEGDKGYGASLWKPLGEECLKWLKSKPNQSVVYISFGSMVSLSTKQMDEMARALIASELNFLWVVRESERSKLPQGFVESARGKGLVVSWCNQLEMLAHPAIGCFVTHCGWNSTLELLSLGVPTVAMPQWSDQFTDAKFIEEIWKVGVRPKLDKYGIVNREELVFCLKEVMEGEMSEEIKRNARKWRELAKGAVSEGGSSDKTINEFVDHLKCSKISKQIKQMLNE